MIEQQEPWIGALFVLAVPVLTLVGIVVYLLA